MPVDHFDLRLCDPGNRKRHVSTCVCHRTNIQQRYTMYTSRQVYYPSSWVDRISHDADHPASIPRYGIEMSDSEHDRLSRPAIDKILTWSRECQMKHRSCRRQSRSILPTRVIDTSPDGNPGGVQLIVGMSCPEAEYLALSHCWGMMPPNSSKL